MAFDYANAILMTRAQSILIAQTSDTEVQSALTEAIARIKLHLMTATSAKRNGEGTNVFYAAISDLADSIRAAAAEALVMAIMEEDTVKNGLRRVASCLAAATLINAQVGVLESQQKIAYNLEKQAINDLDRLCKSPMMTDAVMASKAKALEAVKMDVSSLLFFALDANPTTIDSNNKTAEPYTGAQLPFAGAPEAGKISAILNGAAFEAYVAENDTPVDAIQKLIIAFEQMAVKPNVALAPDETPLTAGTRLMTYVDAVAGSTTDNISYTTTGARLALLPRDYDNVLDVAVMTLSLSSRDPVDSTKWVSGIRGFVYGTYNTISLLTHKGPHAVAVDLKTGKSVSMGSSTNDTTNPVSDSFFFQVPAVSGVTAAAGELRYRINSSTEFIVAVPAGTDALGVVELFAQSMANESATTRVLGAVRPSSELTVNGTPLSAPGIEMVTFGIESTFSKAVVWITSVPAGVTFGVVPPSLITSSLFDARSKSIVVDTTISHRSSSATPVATGEPTGDVFIGTYTPTPALQKLLNQLPPLGTNFY